MKTNQTQVPLHFATQNIIQSRRKGERIKIKHILKITTWQCTQNTEASLKHCKAGRKLQGEFLANWFNYETGHLTKVFLKA